MRLAILMTNTDESAFAQRHPKDGQKFTELIQGVRPDWRLESFAVKDDVFPGDITGFDGIVITGSPASVLDADPWIARLMAEIRKAHAASIPMFGACFGHQAIALALGGRVARNPAGWGFGLIEMTLTERARWYDGPERLLQYGAHVEQVTHLPDGALRLFTSPHCDIAGFALDTCVYTTQNHPEMTPDFVAALVEEYADTLPSATVARARASLARRADTDIYARSIAAFFESAHAALADG